MLQKNALAVAASDHPGEKHELRGINHVVSEGDGEEWGVMKGG